MKLNPFQFSILLLAIFTVIGLVFSACESDPLLEPQSIAPEETGSYGNTNLPVRGTDNSNNAVNAAQNKDIDGNRYRTVNPKLF